MERWAMNKQIEICITPGEMKSLRRENKNDHRTKCVLDNS